MSEVHGPVLEPIPTDEELPTDLDQFDTLVARWSRINFARPIPLVDRWDIRPGDLVQSSHGIRFRVKLVHRTRHPRTGDRNASVMLKGTLHDDSGPVWAESYPGAIPLIERAGIRYLDQI